MAQLLTVRLNKSNQEPLGFRLQGGKDFGTPLVVQKVNGGSAAERAGLQAGDALIRVNNADVYTLRHQEAQDAIRAAGTGLELTVQRGGGTWRPSVTPTGSLPRPGSRPLGSTPTPVTNTSLKATSQPSRNFGSGHNNVAKPFGYMNGGESVKSIVNKQYNTPVNMYSDKTIAETLSAQTEVLAGGVLGVNFKKNEKTYDAEKSAVFKVLQEAENDPEPEACHFYSRASVARAGTPCSLHRTHRSRSRTPRVAYTPQPSPAPTRACAGTQTPAPAPEKLTPEPQHRPSIPVGCHQVLPDGRIALGAPGVPQPEHGSLPVVNDTPYCSDCNRYIIGVFVRIKDKNLHVECFKCSTCGTSLKNQGYYNLNGKLYCDIHAKLVARQHPPAPNLEPVTVPPGGRLPTNSYSTPLPPLATNNYTNGSSSLFSPSSNLSGPKPFGSSIGSAYSPSLSPRSAPMSPARPVAAPAPAPTYAPAPAPTYAPAPAPTYAPAPAPTYAPAPAPTYAPAPALAPATAPFAPTHSVKGIVWPPPNPPDDELPKHESILQCSKLRSEQMSSMVGDTTVSQIADNTHQSIKQNISSSEQTTEYSSNVSYASATMSTATATSSKSEYVVHSQQTQESESSHIHQSSIQNAAAESQSVMIYKSQTSPPVQKSFENPLDNMEQMKKKIESQTTVSSSEFTMAKESKSVSTFVSCENVIDTNVNQIIIKPKKDKEDKKLSSVAKTVTTSTHTDTENNKIESKEQTQTTTAQVTANETQFKESVKFSDKDICKELDQKNAEESAKAVQDASSFKENAMTDRNIKKEVVDEQLTKFNSTDTTQKSTTINVGPKMPMVEALTIAPDRPYSPLPTNLPNPTEPDREPEPVTSTPEMSIDINQNVEKREVQLPPAPSPMFSQQPKIGITSIQPIKTYNPPQNKETPIPMPPETTPYIPPDFKINIEPRVPREETSSPLVDALTTAPNRPFTPVQVQNIERGSLREALTIAPDRPYSPLPLNAATQSSQSHYTSTSTIQVQSTASEIIRPIATQTTTQHTDQVYSEFSSMQNTYKLQSSSDMSAFRPVAKQVFPPPQPEEFCKLATFPPISDELKTSFEKSTRTKQEMFISESKIAEQSVVTTSSMSTASQGFSSVKSAQQFFETLDQRETLSSTAARSKSGLQKPDKIPSYQRHFEQLPSQRGITPEICNAPAILQRPVSPTTEPPTKPREKSVEPKSFMPNIPPETAAPKPSFRAPAPPVYTQFQRNTSISMTFQPVTDENFLRASPVRSRPTTPSLINKPAPIIPHYQMNLVTVEHLAPECHLHDPSSREGSRSPTPKLRSKSPAQGPPPNPLKAHAPRLKESTPHQHTPHTLLTQATSNLRKEHEMAQKDVRTAHSAETTNTTSNWASNQPMIQEQVHSNIGYKSETYKKQDMNIKEDSMINQNYGQRKMQSQNVAEYCNTTVQTTRKTFEEFERTQSAKVIEIRKGGSSSSTGYSQIDSNIIPSSINPKQIFPPPIMSMPTSHQNSSLNLTNESLVNTSRSLETCQPKPSISGANQDPVCDPTPSTGSSVGAAARGKAFGVSSAPKRGRGVLNKAALPGSRVPLCASCNGNIRGPFITALGRIWCPEHFICVNATCRRPLQDIGFVEENGQLYCEYCFEQYIAPACDKCHAKIKGDCLNAIGKHFHPDCFNCVYCGKLFGNNPFFLEDGLPYCESDWNELFTTKCFACGFPVEAGDRWVEALNNNYHSQCFNCTVCKKNLEGQSFFAKGGRPFCKTHAR